MWLVLARRRGGGRRGRGFVGACASSALEETFWCYIFQIFAFIFYHIKIIFTFWPVNIKQNLDNLEQYLLLFLYLLFKYSK